MLGITEGKASFHDSLSSIGKSDGSGKTIAISYVSGTAMRFIPLIVRLAILIVLFILPFYRQPFLVLPDFGVEMSPGWYTTLRNWEAFDLTTWALGVLIYLMYFAFTIGIKNGLYRGVPGAEIHFGRYGKIVYTVRPGEKMFIVDPRVRPFAVVSTRIMTAVMPKVSSNTRDNISLDFFGTLVFRVNDTLKLLQAGGFQNFFRQLIELHASYMKDEIQRHLARDFNRFYVDPVTLTLTDESKRSGSDVVDRLSQLSSTNDLTVGMLEGMAEIEEIDVSQLNLGESATPARREIIPTLQRLADTYGVEIIDHVPGGNTTSAEYLHTLALPLVSAILRLKQATDILRGITENVIDADIQSHVASRQMLVLEIEKILNSIKSASANLKSDETSQKLTESKALTMENTADAILTTQLAQIDGLLARVKAGAVDLAGVDLLVKTMEKALEDIENAIKSSLPDIETVVVDKLDASVLLPDVDFVKAFLEDSGIEGAIVKLEKSQNTDASDPTEGFLTAINQIKVDETVEKIDSALKAVSANTGMSTSEWTLESVDKMIANAEQRAGVNRKTEAVPVLETATA